MTTRLPRHTWVHHPPLPPPPAPPFRVSYPEMVKLAGGVPVILDTTPEDGFLLRPEQLAAALTPRSRMLILCTPSNPTGAAQAGRRGCAERPAAGAGRHAGAGVELGCVHRLTPGDAVAVEPAPGPSLHSPFPCPPHPTHLHPSLFPLPPPGAVYPLERLQALAAVVSPHPRLLVLSDEIYECITYAPAAHHSFAALPGMWGRTLTVNGFSKARRRGQGAGGGGGGVWGSGRGGLGRGDAAPPTAGAPTPRATPIPAPRVHAWAPRPAAAPRRAQLSILQACPGGSRQPPLLTQAASQRQSRLHSDS